MKAIRFGMLAVSMVLSGAVFADAFYAGIGLGRSDIDADVGSSSFDDTDISWKILGGYRFTDNFALEAAWVDLGDFSDNVSYSGGVAKTNIDINGLAVSGVGSLPVGESAAVFGKLGIWSWDSDASVPALGVSPDDDGTDVMFGLGGSYSFTNAFSVRAEWERYKADDDDADLFGVTGIINF